MAEQLNIFDFDQVNQNEGSTHKAGDGLAAPAGSWPISQLVLSTRTRNLFAASHIETTDDLIGQPLSVWMSMRGCGSLSFQEISSLYQTLTAGEIPKLQQIEPKEAARNDIPLAENLPVELGIVSTKTLSFSTRTRNQLDAHHIQTMEQICSLSINDLLQWKGLGKKSMREIVSKVREWVDEHHRETGPFDTLSEADTALFTAVSSRLKPVFQMDWKVIHFEAGKAGLSIPKIADFSSPEFSAFLQQILSLESLGKEEDLYWSTFFGQKPLTREELRQRLFERSKECAADLLIDHALETGILYILSDRIFLLRPSAVDYYKSTSADNRNAAILDLRIHGASIAQTAQLHSVSRQRVDQIVRKTLKEAPLFMEDWYADVFHAFCIPASQFVRIFPQLSPESYAYLSLRYKKGCELLNTKTAAFYDGVWSETLKAAAGLFEEEEAKSMNLRQLSRIVLKAHPDRSMDEEEILDEVRRLLQEGYTLRYGKLSRAYLTNELRTASDIVFNQDGKARLYELAPEAIFEKIDFLPYLDHVISAVLIYRDHPDLMKELDLRDAHELYSVIKRSLSAWAGPFSLTCRRNPVLVVGDGDESRQVLDLLEEFGTIGTDRYFEEYEKRYGHRQDTSKASPVIAKTLRPYLNGREYCLHVPTLDSTEEKRFKEALAVRDLWMLEDVQNLFDQQCPKAAASVELSGPLLYSLGWKKATSYIYSRKYASARQCFESLYFVHDEFELGTLDSRIRYLSIFVSLIDAIKQEERFFEDAPGHYISRQRLFDSYGITAEDIQDARTKTPLIRKDPFFNSFSLWNELSKIDLFKKIEGNFWLADSFLWLCENAQSLVLSNGRILAHKGKSLSLVSIADWLKKNTGCDDPESLTAAINERFGVELQTFKLKPKLQEAGESQPKSSK